jgi:hypothetical protein
MFEYLCQESSLEDNNCQRSYRLQQPILIACMSHFIKFKMKQQTLLQFQTLQYKQLECCSYLTMKIHVHKVLGTCYLALCDTKL